MEDLKQSKAEIAAEIADRVAKDFEAFTADLSPEHKKLFMHFGQSCALQGQYSDAAVLKWYQEAQDLKRQLQMAEKAADHKEAPISSFQQLGPAGAEAYPGDVVAAVDWLRAFRAKAETQIGGPAAKDFAGRCTTDAALLMHLQAIQKYDPILAGDERDSLADLQKRLAPAAASVKPQAPKI